jgi:hypothetical protein
MGVRLGDIQWPASVNTQETLKRDEIEIGPTQYRDRAMHRRHIEESQELCWSYSVAKL